MKSVVVFNAVFLFVLSGAIVSVHGQENKTEPAHSGLISEAPNTIDPVTVLPKELTKKVTVEFKDWSLEKFTKWLEESIGMPVYFDGIAMEDAGISVEEPVSGKSHDAPVYLLLQRVLSRVPEPLTYYIKDEILRITTVVEAEEILVNKAYNLSHLLESGYTTSSLTQVLMEQTAGPWFNIDGVGGTISWFDDVVFVRSTQDVQREAACLLKALHAPGRQTYVLMPKEDLEHIQKLNQKITVEFVETPLDEVLAFLAEQSKVPIQFDEFAMEDAGIDLKEPVTLRLKDVKIKTILELFEMPEPTTWIAQDGVIMLTTEVVAEEIVHTVVYNVQDLCLNKVESEALLKTIQDQTSGPWFNVDGVGGTISSPAVGTLVVRQTAKLHQEIVQILVSARELLGASYLEIRKKEDDTKILTRIYKIPTDMAESLAEALVLLVAPDSWEDRMIIIFSSEAQIPSTHQNSPKEEPKPTPHSVLVIKQTKAIHQQVQEMINRIKHGDASTRDKPSIGGFDTGNTFGGYPNEFGGASGMFSLPAKSLRP